MVAEMKVMMRVTGKEEDDDGISLFWSRRDSERERAAGSQEKKKRREIFDSAAAPQNLLSSGQLKADGVLYVCFLSLFRLAAAQKSLTVVVNNDAAVARCWKKHDGVATANGCAVVEVRRPLKNSVFGFLFSSSTGREGCYSRAAKIEDLQHCSTHSTTEEGGGVSGLDVAAVD
ncbi:carbamoyl-phosphate synthase large chain [Striga asiatica]|uniref:Carbamoyl-phosphate synthase large chain n=1 Tax=Striga asiatica TaxID=4170 RepID=A0A5A7QG09_STRAF|nr:carbamoyl-phosphate synthase large chain [Striga asiatica]